MQSPLAGDEAVKSEYMELELHMFGKVFARASSVQTKAGDSSHKSGDSSHKSGDCICAYSALPDSEVEPPVLNSGSNLIGTIHGLGGIKPQLVCVVLGSDVKSTHRIVEYQSPVAPG